MKCPVVVLKRALYGHPDSGSFWEEHCEAAVKEVGFETVEDWPSCYWHPTKKLFLSVYVDDFKMAGPEDELEPMYERLGVKLKLERQLDGAYGKGVGLYLGCKHEVDHVQLPNGVWATRMTYNMEEFFELL